MPIANRLARMALLALVGALLLPAQAQVLRCVGPKGEIEFSNQTCPKGWKSQKLELKENTVNQSGAREQALRLENERLKEQLKNAQSGTQPGQVVVATPKPALTEADLPAQRRNLPACEDAAWRYEIAAGSIDPRKDVIAARRSAMFLACGIPEPPSTTVENTIVVDPPRPCLVWGWRYSWPVPGGPMRRLRVCLVIG